MAVGPTSEKTYAHPHCVQAFYPLPGEWGVYRATLIISSSSKSFCKSLILNNKSYLNLLSANMSHTPFLEKEKVILVEGFLFSLSS